jgi:hypothetical protein
VIGETAIVGDRVTLYQGVTLGAKSFQVDKATGRLVKGLPRHPIVEDDVTIYASATVLGRVTVGRGSIIGGNVWLTHNVPPNSRISQPHCNRAASRTAPASEGDPRVGRKITRREFSRLAAGAGSLALIPFRESTAQLRFASQPFQLGVASGDPSVDGFVIWTRLAPEPFDLAYLGQTEFEVAWEVSEDAGFSRLP